MKDISVMKDLLKGLYYYWAGLRWLFRNPRFLLRGAIPAAGGLVLLFLFLGAIVSSIWLEVSPTSILAEIAHWWVQTFGASTIQVALIAAAAAAFYTLFPALALMVSNQVYVRITKLVSKENAIAYDESPRRNSAEDALSLAVKGLTFAVLAFLLSLIPFVGGVLGFLVVWTLIPFFVAEELLACALPVGPIGEARAQVLPKNRKAIWAFGVLSQLLFTIPLVQVFAMPAAVSGAAIFASDFLPRPGDKMETSIE